jgi:hypothetical protein
MGTFADIARIIKASDGGGSWADLTLLHGVAFALGIIGGGLAFLVSRSLGWLAVAGALYYLANLVTPSAALVFSFIYIPAWVAWGVVFVAVWKLIAMMRR